MEVVIITFDLNYILKYGRDAVVVW